MRTLTRNQQYDEEKEEEPFPNKKQNEQIFFKNSIKRQSSFFLFVDDF
jgi:hypothetical protein